LRRIIIFFQLIILSGLAYSSAVLYIDFVINQKLITNINNQSIPEESVIKDSIESISEVINPQHLFWDADISYIDGVINSNRARPVENKGLKQDLLSQAYSSYQRALYFRPRAVDSMIGSLSILIDHIISKLDHIISIIPTDDMFKAEATLVCFKLMSLHIEDTNVIESITMRLKILLSQPIDYRAMTQVKRYAKYYSKTDELGKVLSKVLNDD